jgi:hypothetical protein
MKDFKISNKIKKTRRWGKRKQKRGNNAFSKELSLKCQF